MTVEPPDHFMGKPIPEDAIEIALAAEKKDGNEGEAPPLADFIYVRSIDLYFAKEKSHLGKDWENAHRELHKQNLRMPTIPQFVKFLKYLRTDQTAENTRVYKEITEARDPWGLEWLDAKFYAKGDDLGVAYNPIVDSHGDLVAQNHEKLEGHLMQGKRPGISLGHWLNNPTKQGLPQADARQGDLWYWHPRAGSVTCFAVDPVGAGLGCNTDPGSSNSRIGVRAVRTRTQNTGGNQ